MLPLLSGVKGRMQPSRLGLLLTLLFRCGLPLYVGQVAKEPAGSRGSFLRLSHGSEWSCLDLEGILTLFLWMLLISIALFLTSFKNIVGRELRMVPYELKQHNYHLLKNHVKEADL